MVLDQIVGLVIRPPRAEYSVDDDLPGPKFAIRGRHYRRHDVQLVNKRGHVLECSHYRPEQEPEGQPLPCVIYCHGNREHCPENCRATQGSDAAHTACIGMDPSPPVHCARCACLVPCPLCLVPCACGGSGCRADANDAVHVLLPQNITVLAMDFSGSGKSQGEYVSLGKLEVEDLEAAVDYLRAEGLAFRIGLWGRSMGAVTALMYAARDPSVAGVVLDSPFNNLNTLILELVDFYKIPLPKFSVKLGVLPLMRRAIRQKAGFDINDLDAMAVAKASFIPALFAHATGDVFIQPHHSLEISEAYAGDMNRVVFPGDHNTRRPAFFYDSVSIFFHNVLQPPPGAEDSAASAAVDGWISQPHLGHATGSEAEGKHAWGYAQGQESVNVSQEDLAEALSRCADLSRADGSFDDDAELAMAIALSLEDAGRETANSSRDGLEETQGNTLSVPVQDACEPSAPTIPATLYETPGPNLSAPLSGGSSSALLRTTGSGKEAGSNEAHTAADLGSSRADFDMSGGRKGDSLTQSSSLSSGQAPSHESTATENGRKSPGAEGR